MARGWESKAVEGQIEEAKTAEASAAKRPLSDEEKSARRERETLKLSRTYLLSKLESSSNERYRESLRKALEEIEQKLAQLDRA